MASDPKMFLVLENTTQLDNAAMNALCRRNHTFGHVPDVGQPQENNA